MPKFRITAIVKDYYTFDVEAEDALEAEDIATDICQAELPSVSEKKKAPTIQFLDSDWDFPYVDQIGEEAK